MTKNITFFTCCGIEDPGGIGRSFPLAKGLVRKGLNINYLALHSNFKTLKEKIFVKDGVRVHYVGQLHVLKKGDKKYYFNKWQLLKVVFISTLQMCIWGLRLKSDVIYCFRPQPINGLAALLTKLIKQRPLILDCEDYEAMTNRLTKFQKLIFTFFEDKFPFFSDKVTFHNMFLKDRYLELGFPDDKFVYLPNGVDAERFYLADQDKSEVLRKKTWPFGEKSYFILRLIKFKVGACH